MSMTETSDYWWITYDRGGLNDIVVPFLEDAQETVRSLNDDPRVRDLVVREIREFETVDTDDFLSRSSS